MLNAVSAPGFAVSAPGLVGAAGPRPAWPLPRMPDDQQRDQAKDDHDEVHPGGRPARLTEQDRDRGHRGDRTGRGTVAGPRGDFRQGGREAHGPGMIFASEGGTPMDPDNFSHSFARLCERAGLGHWHPHELRHSGASLMLAQGAPLHVVSKVLGHASIAVTKDVYGHLLEGDKRAAAESMSRALSGG